MLQIRNGVFETNSSSTHAIAIQKAPVTPKCSHVDFAFGDFGWEFGYADPADYLYTAIVCYYKREEIKKYTKWIASVLGKYDITCWFAEPRHDSYGYISDGYIDHSEGLGDFLGAVLSDEDRLVRYLFGGDSFVATGNDNADGDDYMYSTCWVDCDEIYVWDDNGSHRKPNPYHDEEHFEYYSKGN